MDGIVADLATPWYARYNERTGKNITTADVRQWDVGKAIGDKSIYKILTEPGLYRTLPPIQPGIETIKMLSKMRVNGEKAYEVFILTAAIAEPNIIPDKIWWLEQHMPFIDRKHMMFVYHKGFIHGDYFIDDANKNLIAWKLRHPHGTTVTVTYPYNSDYPADIRGDSYLNFDNAWSQIGSALADKAMGRSE